MLRVANVTASEDTAVVVWLLETNGITRLLAYSLVLTTGQPGPDGIINMTTMTLTEQLPDGTVFRAAFEDLQPGVMYSLQISGNNSMHSAMTFFTFETDPSMYA